MSTVANLRSLLFAPGSDERKLRRALQAGADAVIADLEDAVAPGEKDTARDLVAEIIREQTICAQIVCAHTVRINSVDTDLWEADLRALEGLELAAIVLPKATPAAVDALGEEGPPLIAIVETAQGLRLAYEIAERPRVEALALGAVDLGAELRLEPRPDGQEILYARSKLVIDSAAAGIGSPLDVVFLQTRDDQGLEREALAARSLGMGGKFCIHPAQVGIVNRVFAPTDAQLEWARAAIEVYEDGVRQGRGAVSLNGAMIDLPVVDRARRLLERGRIAHAPTPAERNSA